MSERLSKVLQTLEDIKAEEITVLDVRSMTSITDYMIICQGRSSRHIQATADKLAEAFQASGLGPIHVEGEPGSEWVLIDLIDIVVHIMSIETRKLYQLEKLWDPRVHQ